MQVRHSGRLGLVINLTTLVILVVGLSVYRKINVTPGPPIHQLGFHWPFVVAPWMSVVGFIFALKAFKDKSERASAFFSILISIFWMLAVYSTYYFFQNRV